MTLLLKSAARRSFAGPLLLWLTWLWAGFAAHAQTAPATLDLSQFNREAGQDFTTATGFDPSFASNVFGNSFWFSGSSNGLLISSSQSTSPPWQQSGFMQLPNNAANGFGYGVFHFRSSIPASQAGQGFGINLIMWNADGSWIDSKNGNQISEVDLLEANGTQGFATVHYYDPNARDNNGQRGWAVETSPGSGVYLDITQQHDYDLLWEAGLMAMYVDGKLLWSVTGSQVPADYAHGGINKTIGAQVVIQVSQEPLPTVQLWVQNAFHYTRKSGSTPSGPTTPPTSSLRPADNPSGTQAGLAYQYYEATGLSQLPDFSTLTPAATGTVTNFDLSPRKRGNDYAFRYAGYVQVPQDGQYTFYTSSDDGSRLYVGTQLVVNNDGLHGAQERSGTIGLKAGWHALTVGFFQRGGGQTLAVSYQGPGLSKRAVPAAALAYVPAATSNGLVSGATYRLLARHSGKALDVPGNAGGDEVPLQQYAANGTSAQAWVVTLGSDGYYTLTHQGTNQVLDLYANDESDGAAVQQYHATGVDAQKWRLVPTGDGYYKVLHKDSNKGLDVNNAGQGDGERVQLWEYVGGQNYNQQWQFDLLSSPASRQATAATPAAEARLYPNPASASTALEYESPAAGAAELSVVSPYGRTLYSRQVELSAGANRLELNTAELPEGVHVVRLRTASGLKVLRLQVAK